MGANPISSALDRPQYKYYEFIKQLIWIVLSAGLLGAYLKRRDTDDFNFLSLAVLVVCSS